MFARYLVSTRQKNNARFASGLNKEARDIFVLERGKFKVVVRERPLLFF